jgi:Ni,Fe-hydrogenase III small subunit
MWFDTYATLGGVDQVLPVAFHVPGCPPRPEAILHGVAVALGLAPKKVSGKTEKQDLMPDPPAEKAHEGASR